MAKDPTKPRQPLVGMVMVFVAMAVVGVTAYMHWPLLGSILGYALALVVALLGFYFVFKDLPAPPEAKAEPYIPHDHPDHPHHHTPADPATTQEPPRTAPPGPPSS